MSNATVLRPIAPRATVGEETLGRLREAVLSGALAPGQRLAEAPLAKTLATSRAPIREALIALEREGLVDFDRRGSAVVRTFGPDDLRELYELRQALEPMAARLAARHFQKADETAFRQVLARMAAETEVLPRMALDLEFHGLVFQASRNARLLACWGPLAAQLRVALSGFHQSLRDHHHAPRELTTRSHTRLLKFLMSGDEEAAARAMADHIAYWGRHQGIIPRRPSAQRRTKP